ncbi:DNA recombination protein RmuC [Chromohalobacter marismortui]|uniref:DNA recombination protein RmuC n=1 Tax=Chromohalobacter marismortui TaxID=42055 RepID=A0A4R7NI73_9GAMM|nr:MULTISPECIES: DNA recombination protein RmuC [Chromohalobacter]MCI0510905.1 DNA recombination protein RmuC [Chromohalobacter sp.]MCI0592933.1 DNA recombination protein RmuC [Chromohalobacter sp.]TDU20162.1 DNA recombination protein RmuC [Chromohalobacter marismortui]
MSSMSPATAYLVALAALLALATLMLGVAWRRERTRREAAEHDVEHAQRHHAEAEETRTRLERELAQSDAQLDAVREQGLETRRLLEQRERDLDARQEQLAALRERHGRLETQLEQERSHHAEKLALLEEARTRLTQDFEALAGRIFEERQRTFNTQSRENLEAMLTPFREQVGDFRARLEEIHGQSLRERSSLKTQIEQLSTLNRQITEEAANLTRALKGDKKMQGDWGEVMLESVLERSGLRRDIEYKREVSMEGEAGRQRPDAVIYLPDNRHLIVDAKVSLNAYVRYVNAEDDATRTEALKAHVQAVRAHIDALSGRDYPRLSGLNSPDFVFLFMPVEPAFAVAFQHDETLFQDAFSRDIVVVTPTTLLASLRTVTSLWTLERQNDNARVIAERAGKLLDKFRGFVDSLEDVGRHLGRADGSYRQAMGRLSTGQGSLVSQALMLKRLGVRMKRDLPTHLTEQVDVEEWDERVDDEPDVAGTAPGDETRGEP